MAATHTAHALHLFFCLLPVFITSMNFGQGTKPVSGARVMPGYLSLTAAGVLLGQRSAPLVSLLAALISVGLPASCSSAPILGGGGKRESQLDKCIYLGQ